MYYMYYIYYMYIRDRQRQKDTLNERETEKETDLYTN